MLPVLLLSCVLCVTVNSQDTSVIIGNQTATSIPHNDIINTIDNGTQYRDSIDNIRFACGLTVERYNETVDGDNSKVNTKFRLATVCCPGYKRDYRGICQPYCKGGCGDGFCEFPEICTCPPNCAFNTVDRKCVCFEANCTEACPRNASCVADNTCECDQGFIKSNNWTKQYTNSSIECLPYCFPFCTNKLFTTPELCVCNYSAGGDNETFGNESLESGFYNHQKSHTYLGHLFQSHGHPSFTSGLVGFGLGALVGGMIGSHGKSKYKYGKGGKVYGMGYPGYGTPYGGGYGAPGNSHYGGYGNLGHSQPGHGYPGGVNYPQQGGYPGQGTNYGGNYPAQGTHYGGNYPAQGTNYGGGYPAQGTNYGGSYPGQGTNYGQGQSPNTNYGNIGQVPGQGSAGTYGAPGQNTGVHGAGQTHTQTNTGVYGAGVPGQTNTNKGNVGQGTGTGTNIGWNTQGQGTSGNTGHNAGTGANTGWNSPSQGTQNIPKNTGTSGQSSYGWSVPGQANQGSSGGTNTGQRTNYGWSVPSNTNTGTGAGTGSSGKGSSSGTSWWPFGNSGKGNSGSGGGSSGGGSNSGSKGRKRGRKH